jgi:hypothetical protein
MAHRQHSKLRRQAIPKTGWHTVIIPNWDGWPSLKLDGTPSSFLFIVFLIQSSLVLGMLSQRQYVFYGISNFTVTGTVPSYGMSSNLLYLYMCYYFPKTDGKIIFFLIPFSFFFLIFFAFDFRQFSHHTLRPTSSMNLTVLYSSSADPQSWLASMLLHRAKRLMQSGDSDQPFGSATLHKMAETSIQRGPKVTSLVARPTFAWCTRATWRASYTNPSVYLN